MKEYEKCIEHINRLNSQAISVFIGAGLSKSCGMPEWGELVEPYSRELGLDSINLPYSRIMQYCLNDKAEYSLFKSDFLIKSNSCKPNVTHRLIARLNLPRIWTTNYDGLIENAYDDECLSYQIVASDDDIFSLDYNKNQIIKMHGSLTTIKTTDIVLTESEYENYIYYRRGIYQLLQNDIKIKSILYLGFSFDDINIRRVVSSVWNQKEFGSVSYLFTVPPKDKENQAYYKLWSEDLSRYNIKVVEIQSYSEIETFLYKLLEARFGKTILLIGKRDDSKYNDLAYQIGYKLAQAGYRIHSGGGPNIAHSLADGAWTYLEEKNIPIEDKVVFYYRYNGGSTNPRKGQIQYCGASRTDVRKKMITSDKICILIGDDGPGENGIKEEILIARTKGIRIIPVACSGNQAKTEWKTEEYNYYTNGIFAEKNSTYQILNSSTASIEEISNAIVELADYLLVRNYEE